jgi:hypothetical protein
MRMTNDRCSNNYKWTKGFELNFQYVNIESEQTHNGWRHNVIMVVKLLFIPSYMVFKKLSTMPFKFPIVIPNELH